MKRMKHGFSLSGTVTQRRERMTGLTDHHWVGRKPNPVKYFGFTYLITNLTNGRMYVGKKQYWKYAKRKQQKESDWKVYQSSSKYVKEDIVLHGVKSFEFRILKNYKTRGGLVYGEANTQHKRDVLVKILNKNLRLYYNAQIAGIKFIPKEF